MSFFIPNIEIKPVAFYDITTSNLRFGDYVISDSISSLNLADKIVITKDWNTLNNFSERILKSNEYQFQKNVLEYHDDIVIKYQKVNNNITLFIKFKISNISQEPLKELHIKLPVEIASNDIYTANNLTIERNILKIVFKEHLNSGSLMKSDYYSIIYCC